MESIVYTAMILASFVVLAAMQLAKDKREKKEKELRDHKRWMANREAFELNKSTRWHG